MFFFPNITFTKKLLEKVFGWLKPDGILSVVLQLSSEKSEPVSDTPYQALKLLSSFMHLADVKEFKEKAYAIGFSEDREPEIKTIGGKNFIEMYFKKSYHKRITPRCR